jgi:ubiquinone/menaquinone biosynthesis C-methylase UbiE
MDHSKQAANVFDKLATAYEDKFMHLDLYNDTYDIFCSLLPPGSINILEIACGPGNITNYLLSKRADLKILGVDLAPNMISLAKKNNPAASFKVMDGRDISSLSDSYAGILCGFCLPYLSKEETKKLIADCGVLLNEGGVLYFSAIEDNYEKSGFESSSNGREKCYVYYHEELYLKDYLLENNFESVNVVRKNYSKADGSVSTHIIFIARKKYS